MVIFVRNDQAPLPNQGGDRSRIGRKTHRHDDCILLANEPRNEGLGLCMQIQCATFKSRPARTNAVSPYRFFDCIGTPPTGLGEPEVVVRRDVEGATLRAGKVERFVVVVRGALDEGNRASWDICDGSGEAVFNAAFESARVERVEIRVEWRVALSLVNQQHFPFRCSRVAGQGCCHCR